MNDLFSQFQNAFKKPTEEPKETEVPLNFKDNTKPVTETFAHLEFMSAHKHFCDAYGYIVPKVYRDNLWEPNQVKNDVDYTHMPQGLKEAQTANGIHNHFEFAEPNLTHTQPLAEELQEKYEFTEPTTFDVEQEKVENDLFTASPEVEEEKPTPMLTKALQQSEIETSLFTIEEKYTETSGLIYDRPEWVKERLWIGVDPGKAGAIVAIDANGNIVSKDVIPLIGTDVDPKGIFDLVNQHKEKYSVTVILEEVHSLHLMAANTNFSMGHTLGIILGIVVASQLKLIRAQPKVWQKEVWLTSEIEYLPKKADQVKPSINTKLTSMKAAHRLFPTADFRKSARSKNDHDGITDAVCLAEYGRRKNL